MSNLVLIETKKEYTKSLSRFITPQIYRGIKSIYADAEKLSYQDNEKTLYMFQKLLEKIPLWDSSVISIEYDRIRQDSNCSYLDDLITAVFVCYTKVLTAVEIGSKKTNVQLDIPSGTDFLHKCYIEVARSFWKEPYLLSPNVSSIEFQKNLNKSEVIIKEAIEDTIRKLLPIQHIIKQYLGNSSSIDNDDVSITSDVFHTNLKDILKKDLNDFEESQKIHSTLKTFIDSNSEYNQNDSEINEQHVEQDVVEQKVEPDTAEQKVELDVVEQKVEPTTSFNEQKKLLNMDLLNHFENKNKTDADKSKDLMISTSERKKNVNEMKVVKIDEPILFKDAKIM